MIILNRVDIILLLPVNPLFLLQVRKGRMAQSLFSEFAPSNLNAWKKQAIKDLKEKDFDATLLWHTPEGISVWPYYTSENIDNERLPALQVVQKQKMGWLNQPVVVFDGNEINTNAQIISILQKGAEAILLDFGNVSIADIALSKLLHGLKLSDTPVVFRAYGQETELTAALQNFIPYQMKGGLAHDALAHWTQTGQLPSHWAQQTAALIDSTNNSPLFRTLCVQSHALHNAGANAAQELAFVLASATTYLDKLTDLGVGIEKILPKLYFSISVGTNYFMEMAKLRALRYLWAVMSKQWPTPANYQLPAAFIHAQTSTFYNTAAAPYTNLLRATTEAMSATVGGCDALTVLPYNEIANVPDNFADRIARNVSVLLKEESHLDKTADAVAGSYFIENLTLQLIDAAWALFLEVEKKGGFLAAFEQNFVQTQIRQTYERKRQNMITNAEIMVGVNKYQMPNDTLEVAQLATNSDLANSLGFDLLPNQRVGLIEK